MPGAMTGARAAWRLLTALAAALLLAAPALAQAPQARTESGALRGVAADGVTRFLGVPYAAPPVGALRWAAPRPPRAWRGVRDATAHASGCMQAITPRGFGPWTREYVTQPPISEDCLYLDIWMPQERSAAPRPVMLWIHGGAFMTGSNAIPIYDGAALARQGVVVVSVNYRLGAFGFVGFRALAGEPGGGGNFGVQDILAALRWIGRNAAAFDGDPRQVTIVGQSAGAMAVHMLLLSPLSDGLFASAIAQSGINEAPLSTREDGFRRGDDLVARAGAANVAALRRVPAERILALLDAGPLAGSTPLGEGALLAPVIDGLILPDQLAALEAAGKRKPVPVMVGMTADEGVLASDYFATTPQALGAKLAGVFGPARARALLGPDTPVSDAAALAETRALTRLYGLASLIDWAGRQRGAPVHAYYYSHAEPGPDAARYGAFHSAEIPYVFQTLGVAPWRNFTAGDQRIARIISAYWVNFARTGDPNGEGLPHWPAFAGAAPLVMELGEGFAPYRPGDGRLDLLRGWMAEGALVRSSLGLMARAPAGR